MTLKVKHAVTLNKTMSQCAVEFSVVLWPCPCVQCFTGVVTMQVCAELRQAQGKRSQLEQSALEQASELEHLQQKSRELELQLARNAQSRHSTSSLQEELCTERSRLITADKKARRQIKRVSVLYSVCSWKFGFVMQMKN